MAATLLFVVPLCIAAGVGYLAQITGLCMVRGVSDWMAAKRLRLLAIVSSGFWIYLYMPVIQALQLELALSAVALQWGAVAGGVLFGLGAATNGACSVSTATRLASGDLRMVLTMMGWLLGWVLLDGLGLRLENRALRPVGPWIAWPVLATLLIAAALVYRRQRRYWRMWNGIMLIGILIGALFLVQPLWSPSYFVQDLGLAIVHNNSIQLPGLDRIGLLLFMLAGMAIGAWRYHRFHWVIPGFRAAGSHLTSGTLMGIGAALALGGNDFQLLVEIGRAHV